MIKRRMFDQHVHVVFIGGPKGNRTPPSAVTGRCTNRYTMEPEWTRWQESNLPWRFCRPQPERSATPR